MGKKSKRHAAQAGAAKPAIGSMINNRAVCKVVDDLWMSTQGPASNTLPNLWREYLDVIEVVTSLKEKQGASPFPLPPRKEGLPAFYRWLRANRAEFNKVEVGETEKSGFGIVAKADIPLEERVIRVPETLMMTSETAKASQLKPLIARDRMLQAMPNVALALHLLNERYNPKSFWKPYIDTLPSKVNLPFLYAKNHLQLLQGSPCLADAIQHLRSISKLYAHLHKLLRAYGDTSIFVYSVGFFYEDFVWAVTIVMSRQNEIPLRDGQGKALALIPFWDMCNHKIGAITTDFNMELRCCDCVTQNSMKVGDEFKIFYGARSNGELFLHQGFVYPPNNGDYIRIRMGLSSQEESATKDVKSRLLKRLDIPLSGVFHLIGAEEPFPSKLKGFVRIFTATTEELEQYSAMEDEELKKELLSDFWIQKDIKALEFITKRCDLLISSYRMNMFEHYEQIQSMKMDEVAYNVVLLVISERYILRSAIRIAKIYIRHLSRGEDADLMGLTGFKKKRAAEMRRATIGLAKERKRVAAENERRKREYEMKQQAAREEKERKEREGSEKIDSGASSNQS